jgi:hypothetical protein
LLIHYWPVVAVLGVFAAFLVYRYVATRPEAPHLPGYSADVSVLRRQFEHAAAMPLDSKFRKTFEQAANFANRGEYDQALALLEPAAKQVPLPVLLNDIGILYQRRKDFARAIRSFRQALLVDDGYAPAFENLQLVAANIGGGLATEVEPNNNVRFADTLPLEKAVEGDIQGTGDRDYFVFVAPPAPRDRLEVSLHNRSQTLRPSLQVYDDTGTVLLESVVQGPGESAVYVFGPVPGTKVYVGISGDQATTGAYSISVKALKSFDRYEPNEDMAGAKQLPVAERVRANIMDAEDTDFYSFVSPRTGSMSIEVQADSKSLIPALATFSSDWRNTGTSPIADSTGKIRYSIAVEDKHTYYLEVRPLGSSAGEYSLIIQ